MSPRGKDFGGVLLTDGYRVYERFAKVVEDVTHAQCWVHTRRNFIKSEKLEPNLSNTALDFISRLYAVESKCKGRSLEDILALRREHSKIIVDEFFEWLSAVFSKQVLLPSNAFTKAANYALEREQSLREFLDHPNVSPDTNHIERALRPIPMGRKNWLFCWTELGARTVGILQSLVASCRLQNVDPHTYLIDVLQRIDSHPAKDVHLLTPALWKQNFSDNPLRSDLELINNASG